MTRNKKKKKMDRKKKGSKEDQRRNEEEQMKNKREKWMEEGDLQTMKSVTAVHEQRKELVERRAELRNWFSQS